MADREWKKNLGFLEGLMFDPVAGGILGLTEGLMGLFGVGEKNSQIDNMKSDYEKMKFTEDQMSRRQSNVKQVFGNLSNSMLGASQYLNGDTMRAMQGSKLATESAKAMLDQRMKDEQTNLGITDKINQLEGQKAGYVPTIANMFGQGLQGIFNAEMASQTKDQQEQQNAILKRLMGDDAIKNPISSVTGEEIKPIKRDTSLDILSTTNLTPEKINPLNFLSNKVEDDFVNEENILANYISEESNLFGNILNPKQNSRDSEPQIFNRKLDPLDVKKYSSIDLMPKISKLFSNRRRF